MTWRRVPVLPTLVVLIAVGIMIRLGFWQLDRLHWKEALLARYAAAANLPLTAMPERIETNDWLYRRVWVFCRGVDGSRQIAGHNSQGESGWVDLLGCDRGANPQFIATDGRIVPIAIVAGWSRDLKKSTWIGGSVEGVVTQDTGNGLRVVADPPLGGLQPNAKPDPRDIPNNHLSYAVQWFLFAATALAIYVLALRKRLKSSPERGGEPA